MMYFIGFKSSLRKSVIVNSVALVSFVFHIVSVESHV